MSYQTRGDRRGGRGGNIRGGQGGSEGQTGSGSGARRFENTGDSGRRGGGGKGGFAKAEVFGGGQFPPPDQEVIKLEDDFIKQNTTLEGRMAQHSFNSDSPTRPAYGTKGKSVTLWANYFNLQPAKDLALYRYHTSISPSAKGRKLRRVFELVIRESVLTGAVTDFKSFLVLPRKVDDMQVEIKYVSEMEDDPQPNAQIYRVDIQLTGQMEVAGLLNHINTTQSDPSFSDPVQMQVIQTLNVLLGYYPQTSPSTTTISSNKHFSFGTKSASFDLGGGIAALRGYFRSVRLGTGRMLVNINVKHAVFFQPGQLLDLINAFAKAYGRNSWQLEKFLKKVRVETTHLPVKANRAGQNVPRVKTIIALANTNDGTALGHPPRVSKFAAGPKEVQFWLDTGAGKSAAKATPKKTRRLETGYITVFDFFQKYHNLTIKNPEVPVMNVGTKANPVYLPAEYCQVLPGQASMKKLSADETAAMIRFACRKPFLNAQAITTDAPEVLGLLPSSNNILVSQSHDPKPPVANLHKGSFGISVDAQMITVPGRVLNSPAIKYKGGSTEMPRNGSWNMRAVKFSSSATVPQWTYLWIKRSRRPGMIEENGLIKTIVTSFRDKMRDCGLAVMDPIVPGPSIELDVTNSTKTNDQLIEGIMRSIMEHKGNIGMVFVLLPDTDAAVYNKIKHAGDILYGVHTVCSLDAKAAKDSGRDQYLANIALKVNCKLLGTNQTVDASRLGIIGEGKTMVVGIDVTHPSPGSLSNAPSVAAVVASTDRSLGQFPCELSIQEGGDEMVADLSAMIKTRLDLWRKRNRTLPENILVYRDGVSEGQYQALRDKEIPSLRAACELAYTPEQRRKGLPKVSVVVVGKRHNTRFFATKDGEVDRSANPTNGTVVDRGVTSMWNWDFFLQAHTCLQGTVKPAHYYVVLDEIFGRGLLKKPHPFPNPADTLEDLTHNMCYLFARATKAVSICPPAYYADLACERARCYLSGVFDPSTSQSSIAPGGTQVTAHYKDVKVHRKLQDSMFYI